MRIAVVILNYNGEKLLQQFLPAVINCSGDAEVVVADNGSTDNSLRTLTQFVSVRVIKLPVNYGYCRGYNEALKLVDADVFVLLNSDVEVTAGWLDPIRILFAARPEIAAIQPKILSYHERNTFEYAGAAGGMIDRLGYPFCRGRIFQNRETDFGQYDDEKEIFWASGACLAIRSTVYREHGGLDEDYFAHMEEIDLCWKIHRTSNCVYYTGKSTVYHVGAGTLSYESPFKTYLNFRNNLYTLIKHWDSGELLWKLPTRILLDWLASLSFLIKGQPKNAWSVLRAQGAVVRQLSTLLAKRKTLHGNNPTYSRKNIYRGLIVLKMFSGTPLNSPK